MNVLIFGAGYWGKCCKKAIEKHAAWAFKGFLDNAEISFMEDGVSVPVFRPEDGIRQPYDKIIISNSKSEQISEIKAQLRSYGVSEEKMDVLFENKDLLISAMANINSYDEERDPRVIWLRDFAHYAKECRMQGGVAECGTYRGEFAYYINKNFPEKRLYLFDTFAGFNEGDIQIERAQKNDKFLNGMFDKPGLFSDTNEQLVLKRMLYPEKVILKKGYFPDTAAGVDEAFCFVNLDMDLYQPMLAGIRFFYNKMCANGVILLHDYFHPALPGVKQAVMDFEKEHGLVCKTTIGDFGSIAIIKQ